MEAAIGPRPMADARVGQPSSPLAGAAQGQQEQKDRKCGGPQQTRPLCTPRGCHLWQMGANGARRERSISVPSRGRHRRRSVQPRPRKNRAMPDACKLFTKPAQLSGPENIDPERPLPGRLAPGPVLSPTRITLENNGKIRPRSDGENAFAKASGGGPESPGISVPQASKKRLRCQAAIGGIVYTEGVSGPCDSLIFENYIRPLSGNHSSLCAPSERISRTAASNSLIAFSAATSLIATIRS